MLSADLQRRFPEEMTIVLEASYRDLTVTEEAFELRVFFGGEPEMLTVPFSDLVRFYDPEVQFILQWEVHPKEGGEVVSLSGFRAERGCS